MINPLTDQSSVFSYLMAKGFLKGILIPPVRDMVPVWGLKLVLSKLMDAPFEPMAMCSLPYLSMKMPFLFSITSASRARELYKAERPYTVIHSVQSLQSFHEITSQISSQGCVRIPHQQGHPPACVLPQASCWENRAEAAPAGHALGHIVLLDQTRPSKNLPGGFLFTHRESKDGPCLCKEHQTGLPNASGHVTS